jgi:pimeloyl-ACP methyl ester carboxylesterase
MWSFTKRILSLVVVAILFLCFSETACAQLGVTTYKGTLPDGATYRIEVPSNWNGTLFLYSHGYTIPGTPNPAEDAGDQFTRMLMLSSGFALAGSSYASTGWAIQEALPDQIAVLDLFKQLVGPASRTIAWGHSLGGMVTAGLIQRYPERFDAALPMCGVLSGGVAAWNSALDYAFAFKTCLRPAAACSSLTSPIPREISRLPKRCWTWRKPRRKAAPVSRLCTLLLTVPVGSFPILLNRRRQILWPKRPTSSFGRN